MAKSKLSIVTDWLFDRFIFPIFAGSFYRALEQCARKPDSQRADMPHCDQAVLHAPGECEYCDMYPDWQALRLKWGICFTGKVPDLETTFVSCPSEYHRETEQIYRWPGNRPKGQGQ